MSTSRPSAGSTYELTPGSRFPDIELPDHTGRERSLGEIAAGNPVALFTARGWWCPKDQRYMRQLVALQDEFEVAYAQIVVITIDAPETQSAFRAGLGARFTFLSDAERRWVDRLGLLEHTDTIHLPYRPAAFTLRPDLAVHAAYNGYWYWGRATPEELRRDMRTITMEVRGDWDLGS
jgi:peroxiredoxin